MTLFCLFPGKSFRLPPSNPGFPRLTRASLLFFYCFIRRRAAGRSPPACSRAGGNYLAVMSNATPSAATASPLPAPRDPKLRRMANALARARDGCGRAGEIRPSRHADGHGRRRDGPVHAIPAVRPAGAGLARPRPLRAVERARLDAALRAAAPDRLPRHDARRAEALPAARQPHRRASRARPRERDRDDDRAARPGARQFGRHGARRAACWRPSSATTIVDHHTYVFAGDGA